MKARLAKKPFLHRAVQALAVGGLLLLAGQISALVINFDGPLVREDDASADDTKAGSDKTQSLEFASGDRLHGTLESLDGTKKELVWRGLDASVPITFPLAQITHLNFPVVAKADAKARSTVKLTGGDWLTADVTALRDGRFSLRLADGTALTVDRSRVEWIYFSKNSAPECYEGPFSFSGWTSAGGWSYREGAFRASQAALIGRYFEALPDRVEYRFEFDQGASFRAYGVMLHGTDAVGRNLSDGMVRLMINGTNLQLWPQADQQVQVDLAKFLPPPPKAIDGTPAAKMKPLRWRIFEDRPAGQLVVFIDGKKVGDWRVAKAKPGENRGAFTFQPMAWSANSEQSLSKIRIVPWNGFVPVDDAIEDARPKTDQVLLTDGETKEGRIESITGDKVKIGAAIVARDKIAQLRLARAEDPPDEDPPVGRVRLAQRGEFEVAALGFRQGRLQARTNFAGEVTLPVAALREIEWLQLAPVAPKPVDQLVFKNGDQLRGQLETAGSGQKLRWRTAPGAPPVEMDTARTAGVLLAPRPDRPAVRLGVLARLSNGDLLSGDLAGLSRESLLLENSAAGRVSVPRTRVQTLYFSHDGQLPVLDGAADREVWETGIDFNRNSAQLRKKRLPDNKPTPSLWSYFDGAFAVRRANTSRVAAAYNSGGFNLGRVIEGLPARVDFSFDVIGGKKNQTHFSAYLFSEPENSGYIMQFHQGGMFVYDTGGQQQRGRAIVQQLQVQFRDKVRPDATQHRVRVLADRTAGRMTLLVDGVVVGQFGPKAGAPPRNLARGLGLIPQQNMAITFANLWVAPWNGRVPGAPPTASAGPDSVLLANGDEAQGTIGTATPETLQIEAEVGPLDLPVNRLTMIEFGDRSEEPASGVRLRLTDRSMLTVASYRIENDTVICQSAMAGELKFPLSAVQELVFARSSSPAAKPDEKPGSTKPAGIILKGALNGPVIVN